MFVTFQKILPKHAASRLAGTLAESRVFFIKHILISLFCHFYPVKLEEAKKRKTEYKTFNDFFSRELAAEARKICSVICCPCDGTIADHGIIDKSLKISAKGHSFSINSLLAKDQIENLLGGSHLTIYLAPSDYHRVHMPANGKIKSATYVPGELFSVNPNTVSRIPGLYAKNERLIFHLETDFGYIAIVMVGAAIVGGIKPFWRVTPYEPREFKTEEINQNLNQGDELGLFQLGSTVIMLASKKLNFEFEENEKVLFGQSLN